MSTDRIGPCLVCKLECEGWLCSFACEVELARRTDAKADHDQQLSRAEGTYKARQQVRRSHFAKSWGPKA